MNHHNRHSSQYQQQNEYHLMSSSRNPKPLFEDALAAQVITGLMKQEAQQNSQRLNMQELIQKLENHGRVINHDLLTNQLTKDQIIHSQRERMKYELPQLINIENQGTSQTNITPKAKNYMKTFRFGVPNSQRIPIYSNLYQSNIEYQQNKYRRKYKDDDQRVSMEDQRNNDQISLDQNKQANSASVPIHKLENVLIRCFKSDETQYTLQNIVKFLQHKTKNLDCEYVIKNKVTNRITKLTPKVQGLLQFSLESQNDDLESHQIPTLNVLGINKQLWGQTDQKISQKKQEVNSQIQIKLTQKEGYQFPAVNYQFPTVNLQQIVSHPIAASERDGASTTKNEIDSGKLKSKNKLLKIQPHKSKLPLYLNYQDINFMINLCNKMSVRNNLVQPLSPFLNFKVYVGKGNNGQLIKQLIKNRPNWVIASSKKDADINFYWTQTFKDAIHQKLQKSEWLIDEKTQSSHKFFDPEFPIASQNELTQMKSYIQKNGMKKLISEYDHLSPPLFYETEMNPGTKVIENSSQLIIYNHLKNSHELGNKKSLFQNLKQFCIFHQRDVWNILPMTYHITLGRNDPEYLSFSVAFKQNKKQVDQHNVWIVKPGENTNRGFGIIVTDSMKEIEAKIQNCDDSRSFIIQKYIETPFLYQKRKFDIRCFLLITIMNGVKRVYWYKHGYLRTASKPFNFNNFENKTHLTNDAVQNKFNDYGKFEKGNKVSYTQFSDYLKEINLKDGTNYDFYGSLLPEIKLVAQDAVASAITKFEDQGFPSFELFGLDFMVTSEMKPLLLEFNTNPCIEVGCPVLSQVISSLLDNVIRLVIDPIFQLQQKGPSTCRRLLLDDFLKKNQFELMWHDCMVS